MPGWLKAGLIGAAVMFVLQLISLIPLAGCVTMPLGLVTYAVVGGLAASYLPPTRNAGQGAGQGALAGLVAALVGGVIGIIIGVIQAALGDVPAALSQMPSEALDALRDAGLPPGFFLGIGGATICGSVCCGIGMLIAAGLGAVGGGIYAAAKPD